MHSVTYQAIESGKYDDRIKAIQLSMLNQADKVPAKLQDRWMYAVANTHELLPVTLTEYPIRKYIHNTIGLTQLNQLSKDIIGEFNARQNSRWSDNTARTSSNRVSRDIQKDNATDDESNTGNDKTNPRDNNTRTSSSSVQESTSTVFTESKQKQISYGTTKDDPIYVYVDGSHIKGTDKLGYGAYASYKGEVYTLSGTQDSEASKALAQRFSDHKFSNPTMELLGFVETLRQFANTNDHIVIVQDYTGIINWGILWNYSEGSANREDKPHNTKQPYIKHLVEEAEKLIKQLENNGGSLRITWTKGHSTSEGNKQADAYAKNPDNFNTFKIESENDTLETIVNAFIDKALSENDLVGELELFEVSQREIDIAQAHGLDIRGLSHTINAHDIRHAIKVHGNDSSKGKNQENLTAEHLKRIPDVLLNFDELQVQVRQGKNKSSLVYSKQFDDGKIVTVERAITTSRDKKPRLSVKTVWVASPISANQNTGKDTAQVVYTPQGQNNHTTSQEQVQQVNQVSEATLHSGGANGADTAWDRIGKEYGLVNIKHYYADNKDGFTQLVNQEVIDQDYQEGKIEVAKSAKRNWGYQYKSMKDVRLIRNWSQVKYADTVIAIGTLVSKGEKVFPNQSNDTRTAINPSVTGGTGYAVGMAIVHNKPVYVYNQEKTKNYDIGWYKYDAISNDFIPTQTPKLTKNFAGIGTRQLNQAGKQAIKDVYAQVTNNAKRDSFIYPKAKTYTLKQLTEKVNNFGLADTAQAKLFNILVSQSKLNPEVKFVLDNADNQAGYYNTATNIIHLSTQLPNNTTKLQVVNHELIHALTETGLRKDSQAVKDLTAMYHQLKQKAQGQYTKQLENINEFVAYGLTDDNFAKFIADNLDLKAINIKPKNKLSNALEVFIKAVYSVLGIKTNYKTFVTTVMDSMVAYEPIDTQTKRASDIFNVPTDVQHKFNVGIDNITTSLRTAIPPVLLALDGKQGLSIDNLPLELDKSTLGKIHDSKNLLPKIYDPVAVLALDNNQDLTIITSMVKNGDEILVPIHLKKTKDKYVFHDIDNAFDKENFSTWFDKYIDKVIYYNPNKSTIKVNQNVATPDDIVLNTPNTILDEYPILRYSSIDIDEIRANNTNHVNNMSAVDVFKQLSTNVSSQHNAKLDRVIDTVLGIFYKNNAKANPSIGKIKHTALINGFNSSDKEAYVTEALILAIKSYADTHKGSMPSTAMENLYAKAMSRFKSARDLF